MFLSAFQITIHQLCFKILFKALQDSNPLLTLEISNMMVAITPSSLPIMSVTMPAHPKTHTPRTKTYMPQARGFTPGTNVDIYVVHDQDWNDADPIPQDITGAFETVSVNKGDVGPVLVWNAPLVPGKYDIVIDHEPKTASTTQQQTGWTADHQALSWSPTHRRRHHHHQYRFQYSSRPESSLWLACCVLLA
jgi:hypothetical protein